MSFNAYLNTTISLMAQSQRHLPQNEIDAAITLIVTALRAGKALLICGNGGSAADALHIAGELVGRFLIERPALKVIALTADSAILTAWSNDYGYEDVFARQVEAYGEPGAVLLGLSTSGNSKNVVRAFAKARRLGLYTIALTGSGGGQLAALSDILLAVPSTHTPSIQEVHLCLYHYLCQKIEAAFVQASDCAGVNLGAPPA
jgi:D-sedoheptulose 7-phosphate isomerase